jgi:glucose/arabinose dehydrogenase
MGGGQPSKMEPFLTGFLQGRSYWGRPVDIAMMRDGSVLVSDDLNGAIYRVSRDQ